MNNNEIWLHGSKFKLASLNNETPLIMTNYTNSGLGLFLTKDTNVAEEYAHNGYITILEVDISKCHVCTEDEFWCKNEPFNPEEDLDPMGNYINLPGSYSRKQFLELGYTTLLHKDEEMGDVLVILDNKAAKIIISVPTSNYLESGIEGGLVKRPKL